jgi:hypothetical protein
MAYQNSKCKQMAWYRKIFVGTAVQYDYAVINAAAW